MTGYPPAAPKVRIYNVAPQPSGSAVSPTGKTRMHADSSQVRQHLLQYLLYKASYFT